MTRKGKQVSAADSKALKSLLDTVFAVLELHRQNSKFFLTQVGAHQQQKADQDLQANKVKSLRRDSLLYSEILDLLVNFIVQYLTLVDGAGAESC